MVTAMIFYIQVPRLPQENVTMPAIAVTSPTQVINDTGRREANKAFWSFTAANFSWGLMVVDGSACTQVCLNPLLLRFCSLFRSAEYCLEEAYNVLVCFLSCKCYQVLNTHRQSHTQRQRFPHPSPKKTLVTSIADQVSNWSPSCLGE